MDARPARPVCSVALSSAVTRDLRPGPGAPCACAPTHTQRQNSLSLQASLCCVTPGRAAAARASAGRRARGGAGCGWEGPWAGEARACGAGDRQGGAHLLPSLVQQLHNLLEPRLKAHVQQPVRLVQHQPAQLTCTRQLIHRPPTTTTQTHHNASRACCSADSCRRAEPAPLRSTLPLPGWGGVPACGWGRWGVKGGRGWARVLAHRS